MLTVYVAVGTCQTSVLLAVTWDFLFIDVLGPDDPFSSPTMALGSVRQKLAEKRYCLAAPTEDCACLPRPPVFFTCHHAGSISFVVLLP